MDISRRIRFMPQAELERFMQGLSDVLSTTDIGESEAFKTLSQIEALAIAQSKENAAEAKAEAGMFDEMKRQLRVLSIRAVGIHIVANWDDSEGSDAVIDNVHDIDEFISRYPQADAEDVKAFFDGQREGFVIRRWKDDTGDAVTDTVYWCCEETGNNPSELDCEIGDFVIKLTREPISKSHMHGALRTVARESEEILYPHIDSHGHCAVKFPNGQVVVYENGR